MRQRDYCPTCRERTSLHDAGVCPWCDTRLVKKPGGGNKPLARSRLTEEQLQSLHVAHIAQERSITELARTIYDKVGYKSAASCREAIRRGWRHLGLQSRDRAEAAALAHLTHGKTTKANLGTAAHRAYRREQNRRNGRVHGRRCAGVRSCRPKKGQQCARPAMKDSEFCYQHDPRFTADIDSHLRRIRALRTG